MALARFFSRVYASAGGILSLSRETLETHVGATCVGVRLDSQFASDGNARNTAELIVNLVSRLYGDLHLDGPSEWVDEAAAVARAINPSICLDSKTPTHTIVVGNQRWTEDTIYVRSDGWVARILAAPTDEPPGAANPIAAGAAGAIAVAELFRRVFRDFVPELPFEDINVSLLDFSRDAGARDALSVAAVGPVGLIGVGAVANAAVWTLSKLNRLEGVVTLVDSELIDLSNLQRYILAFDRDENAIKVALASAALERTGVTVVPLQLALEHAADRGVPETLVVSVDNVEARRVVQALLPRLAINGWTSVSGLGASWHYFGNAGPCLACGYHPRGEVPGQFEVIADAFGLSKERVGILWVTNAGLAPPDLDLIAKKLDVRRKSLNRWGGKRIQDLYRDVQCGSVPLDFSKAKGRVEAVPLAHQSALAGVLMAGELIKQTNPELRARSQRHPLIVWDEVLRPAPGFWTQQRDKQAGCICSDEVYASRYARKWLTNLEGGGDVLAAEL